jgi:hypothetical protein
LRNPNIFWLKVVDTIDRVLLLWRGAPEVQLRLLKEVRNVVDDIVTRGLSNNIIDAVHYDNGPAACWGTTKIDGFLVLAVSLQISTYVNAHINEVRGSDRVEKLSALLRDALTDFTLDYGAFKLPSLSPSPTIDIVETLLQHGAILTESTWQTVLRDSAEQSDLLIFLLNNGADPFHVGLNSREVGVEVAKLAETKREEDKRKNSGSKRRVGRTALEASKPLDHKGQSRCSRALSRAFKKVQS